MLHYTKCSLVFDALGLPVGVVPRWFDRTLHYAELVSLLSLALFVLPPIWEEFQGKEIDVWWYSYAALTLPISFFYLVWGNVVKDDLRDRKPTWPGEVWPKQA